MKLGEKAFTIDTSKQSERRRSNRLRKKMELGELNNPEIIALNILIDTECCVCLDTVDMYVKDSFIKMKCCLQNVHKACFLEWIGTKKENTNKCLICRTEFGSMLNYVSLDDILTYTDNHKHTINSFNYALGNIFKFDNINICILDPNPNEQHVEVTAQSSMLDSKVCTFIVSSIIIMLLLISIITHSDNCS